MGLHAYTIERALTWRNLSHVLQSAKRFWRHSLMLTSRNMSVILFLLLISNLKSGKNWSVCLPAILHTLIIPVHHLRAAFRL